MISGVFYQVRSSLPVQSGGSVSRESSSAVLKEPHLLKPFKTTLRYWVTGSLWTRVEKGRTDRQTDRLWTQTILFKLSNICITLLPGKKKKGKRKRLCSAAASPCSSSHTSTNLKPGSRPLIHRLQVKPALNQYVQMNNGWTSNALCVKSPYPRAFYPLSAPSFGLYFTLTVNGSVSVFPAAAASCFIPVSNRIKNPANIWLLSSMSMCLTGIHSRVKWLCHNSGVYHLRLQSAVMKPQHPGEHVIFLPLVRRDDWMCVEIQAAGLVHTFKSVSVQASWTISWCWVWKRDWCKRKIKCWSVLPMCNSQQRWEGKIGNFCIP